MIIYKWLWGQAGSRETSPVGIDRTEKFPAIKECIDNGKTWVFFLLFLSPERQI